MNVLNWKERPFVALEDMGEYVARDTETAKKYGSTVKAAEISNRDYKYRYQKFNSERTMRPPPSSHIHIHLGHLVVRNLGTSRQYETWMPSDVFREIYKVEEAP